MVKCSDAACCSHLDTRRRSDFGGVSHSHRPARPVTGGGRRPAASPRGSLWTVWLSSPTVNLRDRPGGRAFWRVPDHGDTARISAPSCSRRPYGKALWGADPVRTHIHTLPSLHVRKYTHIDKTSSSRGKNV